MNMLCYLKVALSQKVEVDFQIAQNECRKNYPGIEKIKFLTFFAFTGLIYLRATNRFYS